MLLKIWRKKQDLFQGEIAIALGVTQATIARWESGKHFPQKKYWARIEKYTNGMVTISDLIKT